MVYVEQTHTLGSEYTLRQELIGAESPKERCSVYCCGIVVLFIVTLPYIDRVT